MQRATISLFCSTLSLVTFGCFIPLTTQAQVIPDGTTSTTVDADGNNFSIEQGDRIGDNLFHSFKEFSVPTLGSAVFNNAGDIVNIFSRVTGSNISSIDGLLSANGAANLFLINPNGIIFGENASLNLGGSFFASTADSLLFEGNAEFSASNPQAPPLLEVSIPIGINFRDNPGDIANQATGDGLEVAPEESLTLVGGDIEFEAGEATARGGNIELGGLSAAGTVDINDDGSLKFPDNVTKADITLSNAADVDVRGTGGGSITINARNLSLEAGEFGSSFLRAGITADSTSANAQAGDIIVDVGENLTLNDSRIKNQVDSGGVGNSGNITISTTSLEATNRGQVDTSTFGRGNAGSLEITASDTITIDGEDSEGIPSGVGSNVGTEAEGDAGSVTIDTGALSLTNGGQVTASTFGRGNAGSLEITASDTITIDGEDSNGRPSGAISQVNEAVGNAGGVTITTGALTLTNGGLVSSSTLGRGNAGFVEITATDTITFDGEISGGSSSSAISAVAPGAVGDAGGVTIDTGSLFLTNGGQVDVSTFGQGNAGSVEITASNIITIDGEQSDGFPSNAISRINSGAVGNAGGVTITTGSLSLTNGGLVDASTFGQGNAGSVEITANNTITIDGEQSDGFPSDAASTVAPEAVGDAGGVTITTGSLSLTNGGLVDASTFGQGNAGSVEITASDTITIDGEDSGGFPSGAFSLVGSEAVGNAEGVTINTGSLSLTNGGEVSSSTEGRGNAGSVEITASDTITIDGEDSGGRPSGAISQVNKAVGNAGGVTITTGALTLTNGGQVSASTLGQGNAGSVEITARDTITIDGEQSDGISSNASSLVNPGAVGNAGGVSINTGSLTLTNSGTIEASNFKSFGILAPGTGEPGNINIKANSLSLSNQAIINAATQSETGNRANINLQLTEDLILRNNSLISAEALGIADGGNINIDADFIIAFPNQNNDIVANASQGNGGNIKINALSLFGIEERPLNDITNDIDASSKFSLQGDISINTLDFDPTSGLIELPEAVGDATDQISQNICEQGVGSEFIITGKGGLPPNPNETLNNDEEQVGLVEPIILRQGDRGTERQEEKINLDENGIRPEKPTPELVPAQGWIFNDKGEVTLTSYRTANTEIKQSKQQNSLNCSSGI